LKEKVAAPVYKSENTAVGIRHTDYAIPLYQQTLVLTSPRSGDRSVGIVRSRTEATESVCLFVEFHFLLLFLSFFWDA
jgi:hypothetical protein